VHELCEAWGSLLDVLQILERLVATGEDVAGIYAGTQAPISFKVPEELYEILKIRECLSALSRWCF
jgi:hypothetical protein